MLACECDQGHGGAQRGNFSVNLQALNDYNRRAFKIDNWVGQPSGVGLGGFMEDNFGPLQKHWISDWPNQYVAGGGLLALVLLITVMNR